MFGMGSKTIVGLDVGSSSIKAVELKKKGGQIEVAHLGLEPLSSDIVVDSMIVDSGTVSSAISKLFADCLIKTKAVATARALIWLSVNSFEIAVDTVPESTIMESTTMSGASASKPRCATSMPLRPFLSSTALMLEEPTSRPTIVFDPNPNMCPPFTVARQP